MDIVSAKSSKENFAPETLRFHVILHEAVIDRLEYALLAACDSNGLVTTVNYPIVKAIVDVVNVLDNPDLPGPGQDHVDQTDLPIVEIGDSIEAWMHEKYALRRNLSQGPLALVVGRACWRNLDTGEIIAATNPD